MADNRCVCCGEIIPEGMIACPNCLVVSKKKTELKPCPFCGSRILAEGMPIKITTPKVLRPVMRRIGVMCVRCGYWKHSIRAWNRRTEDGKV